MEYKVGVDRLQITNDEENFPYPLKLWYDDDNIYVKVLRLPDEITDYSITATSAIIPWLCLEIGTWRAKRHKNKYRVVGERLSKVGEKISKGGKFYISEYIHSRSFISNPSVNDVITIPRDEINNLLSNPEYHYNRNSHEISRYPPYLLCRGCIRFANDREVFISCESNRASIVSNVAKIYMN